jgi:hypothetical protein
MRRLAEFLCFALLAAVMITAGCAGPQPAPATPSPSPQAVNATVLVTHPPPTETPALIPTSVVSVTPEVTISAPPTPVPKPQSADVSQITFRQYGDSDFSVDYPSDWTATTSTYTPYFCSNVVNTETGYFRICYEREMETIGPFNFYQDDYLFKSPSRIVTLAGADGTVKFVAFTQDFLDQMNGNVVVVPSFAWVTDEFHKMYPDLYVFNHVGNYREFSRGNAKAFSYDVSLPADHNSSAYTEEVVVTVHHLYRFAFITDTEHFNTYQALKERMLSSIKTNDI